MPQILPPDPSSWSAAGGNTGQALGESFSNAFQKRQERQRLSQGLDQLKGQNFNPLEATQKLINSGASESQLAMLVPMLQQYQQNQAAINRVGKPDKANLQEANIYQKDDEKPKEQDAQKEPELKPLVDPELEKEFLRPYIPLTNEQEQDKAAQLIRLGMFNNMPDALAKVREEEAVTEKGKEKKRAEYENQVKLKNNYLSELERKTSTLTENLSKEGLYDDATGQYVNKIEREGQHKIANGESVDKASDWASNKVNRFINKRLDIKREGNKFFPKNLNSTIDNAQKFYAEAGQEKVFEEDLINEMDLSRGKAAEKSFPVKNNKDMSKWIDKNKIPENKRIKYIYNDAYRTPFENRQVDTIREKTREMAEDLPKYLSQKDSLISIAKNFEEAGYDPVEFINHLNSMREEGKLENLTEDQIDQLSKGNVFTPTWGDIYLDWSKKK